jgi:hypothetical protein
MKKLFLLAVIFLTACADTSSKNGDDPAQVENVICANIKDDVLKLNGQGQEEFTLNFANLMAERGTLCTLNQAVKYLDGVLSIECSQDCIVKEK